MLNNCEYFGNYFSVKSFRITFAAENFESLEYFLQNKFKKNERKNHQKSNRYVPETRFQERDYG
jgi:hypothetical protein